MASKSLLWFCVLALFILSVAPSTSAQSDAEEAGWPREIDLPEGKIIIYQPQPESFKGNVLEARAALSVTLKDQNVPVFGAVWFKAQVETDRDARTVEVVGIKVPRVRFPESTEEQEKKLTEILEREIPQWNLIISLDRLLTSLDLADKDQLAAQDFKNDPPKIMLVNSPAILVLIDGEPRLEKIEKSSLERVINTPFLIVKQKNTFYLNGGQIWMEARDIKGPWKESRRPPKDVKKLTPPEEDVENLAADDRLPQVIVSLEPAELIVIDGAPDLKPVEGNDLLFITNSESDILMDIKTQQYFILLSGRWYAAKSLEGPWAYVASDKLPENFARIPEDSEIGHLLVSIAGTEQAKEAVLDAQIPQTSAIQRDNVDLKVEYDGQPQFETVKGTSSKVEYAVNTGESVFKVQSHFYCCHEAVWYESKNASGPWEVCDDVPDEIYTIPPENPHYNVKYVQVYESTPQVVYVGYYPGYRGSYIYGPTLVYGTGWWYHPWGGSIYYPRPYTYGFHVRWNPWYGWSFGFSFSTGPFRFSVGYGGGGYWGPGRYRPYPYYGGARAGYRAGYRHGYYRGAQAGYRPGAPGSSRPRPTPYTSRNNIYSRPQNQARNAQTRAATPGRTPRVSQGQSNNVYADRSGNIHRQTENGQWQQRDNGKWTSGRQTGAQDRTVGRAQPQTKQTRPQVQPQNRQSQLNRQAQARQRGTARTQQSRGMSRTTTRRRR